MSEFDRDRSDLDKFVRHVALGEICDTAYREQCRIAGLAPMLPRHGESPLLFVDAAMRRVPGNRTKH